MLCLYICKVPILCALTTINEKIQNIFEIRFLWPRFFHFLYKVPREVGIPGILGLQIAPHFQAEMLECDWEVQGDGVIMAWKLMPKISTLPETNIAPG